MASTDLIAKVKFFVRKNGLNPENYTDMKILRREREALRDVKTYAEFAQELLSEVTPNKPGYSKCPQCGGMSLIHEDGCMHCRSCGWSACG